MIRDLSPYAYHAGDHAYTRFFHGLKPNTENTSFSYLKKNFDLNTKTCIKAKPVTESRKTNDDRYGSLIDAKRHWVYDSVV